MVSWKERNVYCSSAIPKQEWRHQETIRPWKEGNKKTRARGRTQKYLCWYTQHMHNRPSGAYAHYLSFVVKLKLWLVWIQKYSKNTIWISSLETVFKLDSCNLCRSCSYSENMTLVGDCCFVFDKTNQNVSRRRNSHRLYIKIQSINPCSHVAIHFWIYSQWLHLIWFLFVTTDVVENNLDRLC